LLLHHPFKLVFCFGLSSYVPINSASSPASHLCPYGPSRVTAHFARVLYVVEVALACCRDHTRPQTGVLRRRTSLTHSPRLT